MSTAQPFNFCIGTDSYKETHAPQYPKGSEFVWSYPEARGGAYPATQSAGWQYILKKYFVGPVVTNEKIAEAEDLVGAHFGNKNLFNKTMFKRIVDVHGGFLPLSIKIVPEGTIVPIRNILASVVNTDPECYALTNFCETKLMHVWYPITVATRGYFLRKLILRYLEDTGDPSLIDFKLHDFGYRGVSSEESAAIGGAAHLFNFKGTDTMAALALCRDYYHEPVAGFSIPASEHSTITSWGREHEVDAMANMLDVYKEGMFACVSDSFDIFDACMNKFGTQLRERVLARNGTLVIRPDSGNPQEVLPKVLNILADKFGSYVNSKDYRVINPKVRVIQGDGVTEETLPMILETLKHHKWSIDNIAFGSGGGLLQKLDRDTCSMAFKCSAIRVNGEWRDVYKQPITDSAKASKKGRMILRKEGHLFFTERWTPEREQNDFLKEIFRDGHMLYEDTLSDIRERAKG